LENKWGEPRFPHTPSFVEKERRGEERIIINE
jgi:hypothetical protein